MENAAQVILIHPDCLGYLPAGQWASVVLMQVGYGLLDQGAGLWGQGIGAAQSPVQGGDDLGWGQDAFALQRHPRVLLQALDIVQGKQFVAQYHHRNLARLRVGPHAIQGVKPIQAGHHQVQDHQAGRLLGHNRQSRRAVLGSPDDMTRQSFVHGLLVERQHMRIIVHDEDGASACGRAQGIDGL